MEDEEALHEFIASRSPALLRTAYLLVGDHGLAEDLVQTALVKTYLAWPRIRDRGAIEAYVRRAMVNTATSWWRRRRYRERTVAEVPERPTVDVIDPAVDRQAVWVQLRALPVKQRAVLVLRYYEAMSEAEIADTLGLSRGTVKSHASRGLATLRARFAKDGGWIGVRK